MRKVRLVFKKSFERLAGFLTDNGLRPFPIRGSFKGYDRKSLAADTRSGLNVALLTFPQGMAYAAIAELPIQYGIVSGAVASVIAPFFAGSRHTILGPTNATAFMVFSAMAAFSEPEKLRLLPLVVLLIGALIIFAESSAVGSFIYTLF